MYKNQESQQFKKINSLISYVLQQIGKIDNQQQQQYERNRQLMGEKQEREKDILSKIIALDDTKMQELAELLIMYINKFSVNCLKVFHRKILSEIDEDENIKKLYLNCLFNIALVVLSKPPANASLQKFKTEIKREIQTSKIVVIDATDQARNTRIIEAIEKKLLQGKYRKGPVSLDFRSTYFNE